MILDFTKPIQTRSGRKVRILCRDLDSDTPIAAAVEWLGGETVELYHANGLYTKGARTGWDLVNVADEARAA